MTTVLVVEGRLGNPGVENQLPQCVAGAIEAPSSKKKNFKDKLCKGE